jgi:hypothetical protein
MWRSRYRWYRDDQRHRRAGRPAAPVQAGDRRLGGRIAASAGLGFVRGLPLAVPVKAAEVLDQLGGRAPSVGDGVMAFSTTFPVEVALTASAPDATLRRTYRARQKGRATPLLLIADSLAGQGLVRALGPVDEKAAVREVPGEALAVILSRLVGMPRLSASRELAEELALDSYL